ncbi:MAG: DUF4910 domain-containing protein [Zestosphaera sp.]
MSVIPLIKEVKSKLEPLRLTELVLELSSYHRIQGSREILEAGDYIRASLEELGVETSVHTFNYGDPPKWLTPLIGWDLRDGIAYITNPYRKTITSVRKAWTAVVAHSPPGEFSGDVSYVESDEAIPDDIEVALTSNRSLDMYLRLAEKGAKAILIYRRDAVPEGIPYVGLFPSPSELPKMKVPALSVSRREADRIRWHLTRRERVKVEGFVKSSYSDPRDIKILSAEFGDGSKEVHLTAHYCHPRGTVNDNASGAATLLFMARILNESLKKTRCDLGGRKIRFVWFPEHYGSVALIRKLLSEGVEVSGVLNLDMIGEKQWMTGSILNFIRPPIALLSDFEAHAFRNFYLGINKGWGLPVLNSVKPSMRFDVRPYVAGSDHDSYIVFGIPATSLTNWPDRFYHTSLDTIDKFSPGNALRVGFIALKTALTYTPGDKSTLRRYLGFVRSLDCFRVESGTLTTIRGRIYSRLRGSLRCLDLLQKSGLPSSQYLLRKVEDAEPRARIKKLLNSVPWVSTALITATLYSLCGVGSKDLMKVLTVELGVKVREDDYLLLTKSMEILGISS